MDQAAARSDDHDHDRPMRPEGDAGEGVGDIHRGQNLALEKDAQEDKVTKGDHAGKPEIVCVAIFDDSLRFPAQRDIIHLPVSPGDTVDGVLEAVKAQTVCYWEESSALVYVGKLRDAETLRDDWLKKKRVSFPGLLEAYCAEGLHSAEFNDDVMELLGDAIHSPAIVHLVIKICVLHPSHPLGLSHQAMARTFATFKRFHLGGNKWKLSEEDTFAGDAVIPVDLQPLHSLNNKLPAIVQFPSRISMRLAEHHVFSTLVRRISDAKTDLSALSLSLIGSPGIGKSTLAQMLAWHVSSSMKLDVVHLHEVKPGFVFFKCFTARGGLVCGEIDKAAVPHLVVTLARAEGRPLKPLVIVDGFQRPPQVSYHVVVTSGSFNTTASDRCTLLLPSWSQGNVATLVKLMGKPEDVSARFIHYGGDLRSILALDQVAAKASLAFAMDRITEDTISLQLSNYGRSSADQVDHIRRFSVRDPHLEASYRDPRCWVGRIESSDLRRALIHRQSLRWIQRLVKATVGTPLYGSAHEMSCHCTAVKMDEFVLTNVTLHRIVGRRTSKRLQNQRKHQAQPQLDLNTEEEKSEDKDSGQDEVQDEELDEVQDEELDEEQDEDLDEEQDVELDEGHHGEVQGEDVGEDPGELQDEKQDQKLEITITTSTAIFNGRTKDAALTAMMEVATGPATYWAPEFPTFEEIDAVARCVITGPGGSVNAIALLQYTVAARKKLATPATIATYVRLLKGSMREDDASKIVLVYVTPPNVDLSVQTPYDIDMYKAQFDIEMPKCLSDDEQLELTHVTGV